MPLAIFVIIMQSLLFIWVWSLPSFSEFRFISEKSPSAIWYEQNKEDVPEFEKQMRRKVHYVIKPEYLWRSVAKLARIQDTGLLKTLEKAFN
jgi:type I restriction enzyme M protein